jgi:hypothetical protein
LQQQVSLTENRGRNLASTENVTQPASRRLFYWSFPMRVIIEKTEDGVISVTRETPGEEVEMQDAESIVEAIDIAQMMLEGEESPEEMWNEEVDSRAKEREIQDSY